MAGLGRCRLKGGEKGEGEEGGFELRARKWGVG
jgi:hypothetical protein